MQDPTNPKESLNVYLSPLNSLFAHCFLEGLQNNHKYQFNIMGKQLAEEAEVPQFVSKILPQSLRGKELKNMLFGCDLIVLELYKTEEDEVEEILQIFEDNYFQREKKLVLISHPFFWYQTEMDDCNKQQESDVFNKPNINRSI